ncbi:hypothetical protein BGZ67_010586, partial [Mortierella alpina]
MPSEEPPVRHDGHGLKLSSPLKNGRQSARIAVVKGSWRHMACVFLFMVVSYSIIGGIVSIKRLALPTPKSVKDAVSSSDFSAEWAWHHLEQISQRPHPLNSRENVRVHEYVIQTVRELQDEAKVMNRTVELGEDHVKLTQAKRPIHNSTGLELYESSNVIIRVVGTEGRAEGGSNGYPEAVVVDAHYDSAWSSYGATDDGIGVSVCLEMIRNLIHHPVRHNVIFNINNGEEIGLRGAAAFMKHPWSKDVKAFVNLEGAGAGGRALLLRSSNRALAKHYSRVENSPHANVLGNDIFKLGLIGSGTGFTVYTDYKIPGLDIAFYSRRAFYHTLQDDTEHTSKNSVQHMGSTALVALRSIADSDYLINAKEIVSSESSIYYDVAGLFMLVHSFSTYLIVNYSLLAVVPIFIAWTLFATRKN